MKRVLSIWLPQWPIDRMKRAESRRPSARSDDTAPDDTPFDTAPFVLVRSGAKGLRITAANDAAQSAGLYRDMALADARALIPSLAARPAEPEADAKDLGTLAEWCGRYTPWTNTDGDDGLWLDLTGCAHLFGGEAALLADLSRRLERMGVHHRFGLADTPGAAWAVARFGRPKTTADAIIAPGRVRSTLAAFPVAGLRLDAATVLALKRLGLATIDHLASLPRSALARRFAPSDDGEAVLPRLDQALGRQDEPLSPLRPAPSYRTRLDFAEPLATTEGVEAALARLLDSLCRTLAHDRQGARRLTLTTFRTDGGLSRVSVTAGRPSRDRRHFLTMFAERLETIDPGFGIEVAILGADATAPLGPRQLPLPEAGVPPEDDRDRLARLVDRLSNRLDTGNVRRLEPHQSHIPERAEIAAPACRSRGSRSRNTQAVERSDDAARPFRLLARPEPIRVMAEVPEGPPLNFTWRRMTRRVARAQGPERIAPEWWLDMATGDDRVRDYYQVEDVEGRRYWLFREGLYQTVDQQGPPAWYVHGLFA